MIGGMLAGCDECEGRWTQDSCGNRLSLEFYGMSSAEAMEKYNGGVSDYKAAEGKRTWVNAKGPAENVLRDIKGGLRSACAYVGAARLKDLSKCTTFIRVNRTHNTIYD
jgi:GMP reductase